VQKAIAKSFLGEQESGRLHHARQCMLPTNCSIKE